MESPHPYYYRLSSYSLEIYLYATKIAIMTYLLDCNFGNTIYIAMFCFWLFFNMEN